MSEPTDLPERILARLDELRNLRGSFETHWQELAEHFLPKRADFTATVGAGQKRTAKIYDSTPLQAARGLASAVDGLLKADRWFHAQARDADLEEDEDVKTWIDDTEDKIQKAIYNPAARFRQASAEVDQDLVVLGTSPLFIGVAESQQNMIYRHYHLRDCYISEDADGRIDTAYVVLRPTARQAANKWGLAKMGDEIKRALETKGGHKGRKEQRFTFVWAVEPREQRARSRTDSGNMAWRSVVIGRDDKTIVHESGFRMFPFAVPRWEQASEEIYGRSPAMLALPDAKSLQAVAKTMLRAGQMVVDPPLGVISDSVLSSVGTAPGKLVVIDAGVLELYPNRKAVEPLVTGGNVPLGMEFQESLRASVWDALYRNVLQLPVDAPKMTATEVLERMKEFVRLLGPVFGRLESDYLAPIVDITYATLDGLGLLKPMPAKLRAEGIRFVFSSAMEQARRQVQAGGAARALEFLTPVAGFAPEVWDNFDADAMARDADTVFAMPRDWLLDVRARDEIRAARGQQKQMMEAAQLAALAAQAAPQVASAEKTGREAMMLPAPGEVELAA